MAKGLGNGLFIHLIGILHHILECFTAYMVDSIMMRRNVSEFGGNP